MTEVGLVVNGTEVTIDVEPRLTLADALRHRLGLTGTHLGCEHGVCGACTVLVNGAAVRSCLLFCVQADGAAVTTVEALGEVDDLHPLQAAFRRHHGLQCGFCTPGFLLSSYELLRDGGAEDLGEERLRAELSGVLCRCTGYTGIVAAVREVAAAHPNGLPPPKAQGRSITVRGAGATIDGEAEPVQSIAGVTAPEGFARDLAVPQGEPTEVIEVRTTITPSPTQTWVLMSDFVRMSRCIPGVELGAAGEETFSGHVRVNLGPMRMNFAGAARVLERDPERRTLRAIAAGRDPSGGAVRADLTVGAEPDAGGGTELYSHARLYLSGRAAQFGRAIAGDVGRQLFTEFGACVERTLTGAEAAEPPRLQGGALVWRLLRARMRQLVRRLMGRQ